MLRGIDSLGGAPWLQGAAGFASPEGVLPAFALTAVGIVVCGAAVRASGGLVARRDVVDAGTVPAPTPGDPIRRSVRTVETLLAPPLLLGAWALLVTAVVLLLAPSFDVVATAVVSVAIAGAVRAAAYYREGLSEMLATMLPVSLLGVILLDSVAIRSIGSAPDIGNRLLAHRELAAYGLVALLVLELSLRAIRATVRRCGGRIDL